MATTTRKAVAKKAAEKAELQKMSEMTITIRATEGNIQRIFAMLAFADLPEVEIVTEQPSQLPWEEAGTSPPQLEINRNAVANDIMPMLEKYVAAHGPDEAKKLIAAYGAPRLRDLSDEKLLDLYHTLAAEAASA